MNDQHREYELKWGGNVRRDPKQASVPLVPTYNLTPRLFLKIFKEMLFSEFKFKRREDKPEVLLWPLGSGVPPQK